LLIELASRESGTLRVALSGGEIDVVTVVVTDSAADETFVVEDANALDVYYHPYAYAALRRGRAASGGVTSSYQSLRTPK
jgi:hypothetical protein